MAAPLTLLLLLPPRRCCPTCGGRLVYKPSRGSGGFIGCSKFEETGCTYGRPLGAVSESDFSGGVRRGAGSQGEGGLSGLDERGQRCPRVLAINAA